MTSGQFYKDTRLKYILALALISTAISQFFGFTQLALGILVGSPVGIFNYWLMWDALKKVNKESNKIFLGRSLMRMIISLLALILAMKVGTEFILGVMIGLFLHLLTYFNDVANILTGKKFS